MDVYRTKIVAANWKMNTDITEGENLVKEVLNVLPTELKCKVILAPPFTHISRVRELTEGSPILVGAQNCYFEKSGPFTGEVSPLMLKSLGVQYVIVGHSERRQLFHETNEIVKIKLNAILDAGLKAIFCCGEPLDIRQTETQNIFVRLQLEESLFHLQKDAFSNVCIAYEPIWAIGTGVTAEAEQVQGMHMYIREQIGANYDKIVSEATRIIYGGSIKAENAKELFSEADVDGGLVGGASLSGTTFGEIIRAAC